MTIEELKNIVVSKKYDGSLLILQYTDTDFIPMQYLHEIREQLKCEVEFVDNVSQLVPTSNLFGEASTADCLRVLCADTVSIASKSLLKTTNTVIICKKVVCEFEELLTNCVVKIPKLEDWQIKDYVYSLCKGTSTANLDNLITLCNSDIYRISNEVKKLALFSEAERESVFNDFVSDGIFNDLSAYTIFTFSNAILKKDIQTIREVYKQLDRIDVEPIGLVTVCYNNFKNMIKVQLSTNPSPESTGMSSKQFWAVKYSCGAYTKNELLEGFSMLTSIDKKLKTGELPADLIIDYIVTHLLKGCK